MRIAAALSWTLFFFFALYTHLALIFKVADEVGIQRTWAVTSVLESADPLSQAFCRHEHFDCYLFDPDMDTEKMDLPKGAWQAMSAIHANGKLYEVQLLKITEYKALNNRADYSVIGMMTQGDDMFVAISRVPHMLEWRILGNRYMLTSISIAYLAWGGLLFTVALSHSWMFRQRRAARSAG